MPPNSLGFCLDRVVWGNKAWFPGDYGFAPTAAAFHAAIGNFGRVVDEHPYPDSLGCCVQLDKLGEFKPCCIVTISDDLDKLLWREPWLVYGIIVHEATHVWQFIQDKMGEDEPGDEIEAHALQHIAGELINAYMVTRGEEVMKAMAKKPFPFAKGGAKSKPAKPGKDKGNPKGKPGELKKY